MGKIYTAIRIHAIIHKKSGSPDLQPSLIKEVSGFISDELNAMDCVPFVVNGMGDHLHMLFILDLNRTVSEVMSRVIDRSAAFIRGKGDDYRNFEWQSGYGAFSVSKGREQHMFDYIVTQTKQHAEPRSSAKREFGRYLKHNGFDTSDPTILTD